MGGSLRPKQQRCLVEGKKKEEKEKGKRSGWLVGGPVNVKQRSVPAKAPVAASSAYRFRGPLASSPLPRPFSWRWGGGVASWLFLVLALLSTASSPPRHHINPIPLRSPPCRDAPRAAAGDKLAGAAAAAAPHHRWRPPWRRSRATSPSAPAESPGARPGSSTLPLTLLFGATIRRLAVRS